MDVNNIMSALEAKHPGEKEYLQAVREVLLSVEGIYNRHPEFERNRIIERMVELARHQHPNVRATFHTDIAPNDLILYADENLISQVVINLLKNAMQAIESDKNTDKEGHINIHAYCNEAETILIEISNNGPAIPNDIAEHIFIPFFTTKEGGSGIGLSISRQIMRLSGGNLSLLPGKETTFI